VNPIATPRATTARARAGYRKLVRAIAGRAARRLDLVPRNGESRADHTLRPIATQLAGDEGRDRRLRARARRLARRLLAQRTELDDAMQPVVFVLAAIDGDRALMDRMEAALAHPPPGIRRAAIAAGLAAFSRPALVGRALRLVLDERLDRRSRWLVFRAILARPANHAAVLGYLADHGAAVWRGLPPSLRRYLPTAATGLCGATDADRASELLAPHLHDDPTARALLARVDAQLRRCGAWRDHYRRDVAALW